MWTVVFAVGVLKLISVAYEFADYIVHHVFEPIIGGYDLMKRYDGEGTWAFITGASDGFGAEYAK